MPLIQGATDALPYLDAPNSAEQIRAAHALVQAEMNTNHADYPHPSLPAQRQSKFSDIVTAEHQRIASALPKEGGLDMSRYELLDPASKGDIAAWQSRLSKAYASAEYLRGREINLSLLESYGKNAWLIGNSHTEDILKGVEERLQQAKLELDEVEQARRTSQINVAGEMQGLEENWRSGIGRMIETQAAGERLRLEILERKRQSAV